MDLAFQSHKPIHPHPRDRGEWVSVEMLQQHSGPSERERCSSPLGSTTESLKQRLSIPHAQTGGYCIFAMSKPHLRHCEEPRANASHERVATKQPFRGVQIASSRGNVPRNDR